MSDEKQTWRAAIYKWFDPDRADLRPPAAILNALGGRNTEYYPRLTGAEGDAAGLERTPSVIDIIKTVSGDLRAIDLTALEQPDLELLRERYRESLDEAKAQTEYQDAKASRLLTTISIFLALAGIMFAKFIEYYPAGQQPFLAQEGLVLATYALFVTFLLLVTSGAVVIFHASRTRFRYDDRSAVAEDKVRSRLFYMPISKVKPAAWAAQVATYAAAGKTTAQREVTIDYLRDVAMEAYLVACKAGDKVRYMRPAQDLLSASTKVFLAWILVLALTVAVTPRWQGSKDVFSTTSLPEEETAATQLAPASEPTQGATP